MFGVSKGKPDGVSTFVIDDKDQIHDVYGLSAKLNALGKLFSDKAPKSTVIVYTKKQEYVTSAVPEKIVGGNTIYCYGWHQITKDQEGNIHSNGLGRIFQHHIHPKK